MPSRVALAAGRLLSASLLTLCTAWYLPGCARTDKMHAEKTGTGEAAAKSPYEPHNEPAGQPLTKSVPAPSATTEAARCVVPTPAQAPPQAFPAERCPEDPTGPLDLPSATVSFPDTKEAPRVRAELARDDESRSRGLMYRTALGPDRGMLFSWHDERRRSFWMKNTCIPLDMLFIDSEGYIVGVLENVPTLNLGARSVRCPAQHVLEVNAGWTRRHGVFAGQKLVIEERGKP